MLKLKDKNGSLMTYRTNQTGAVLTKGKRELYLNFKSAEAGRKAREMVAKYSFNQLFTKGTKLRQLGSNVSYIKF